MGTKMNCLFNPVSSFKCRDQCGQVKLYAGSLKWRCSVTGRSTAHTTTWNFPNRSRIGNDHVSRWLTSCDWRLTSETWIIDWDWFISCSFIIYDQDLVWFYTCMLHHPHDVHTQGHHLLALQGHTQLVHTFWTPHLLLNNEGPWSWKSLCWCERRMRQLTPYLVSGSYAPSFHSFDWGRFCSVKLFGIRK